MPGLEDLLQSPHGKRLAENSRHLEHLAKAPETQKLFAMLGAQTGGSLEKAAENAANGDTAQLVKAIQNLIKDPEGARLIQQVKEKL